MEPHEVMGNAFIFLFAGHETTANSLHYTMILLAQRPDMQQRFLDEVDEIYDRAALEGRDQLEYELDFSRAGWTLAIMFETLRLYSPLSLINKWTATDQPITFEGKTYVIPQGTRIAVNATGIHSNPKVWGDNAREWEPSRWIIDGGNSNTPQLSRSPSPMRRRSSDMHEKDSPSPSPLSPSTPLLTPFSALEQYSPSRMLSRSSSVCSATSSSTMSPPMIVKPAKGTFLPFSEGARACSGKKFATVQFVAVLFTLFREHRVELEEGWSVERVQGILRGRKAGALVLKPPEAIPLRFVRR